MQKFDIEVGASFSSRKRTSRSCICLVILSVAVFLFATVSAIFVTLYVMEKNPSAPSTEKASLSYAPSTERKTVTPPSTTTHKEEQKHNGSKTCPPTSLGKLIFRSGTDQGKNSNVLNLFGQHL